MSYWNRSRRREQQVWAMRPGQGPATQGRPCHTRGRPAFGCRQLPYPGSAGRGQRPASCRPALASV